EAIRALVSQRRAILSPLPCTRGRGEEATRPPETIRAPMSQRPPRRGKIAARVALPQLEIVGVDEPRALDLVVADFAHHLAGHAHDDGARWNAPSLRNERAGRDEALVGDLAAAQQDRPDADEGIAPDRPTVEHGAMADDHALADVLLFVVIGVDDRPVLN